MTGWVPTTISPLCARVYFLGSSAINARARGAVAAITVLLAGGCTAHHPAPRATLSPPAVAVAAELEVTPLDVSPDGEARLLVRLHYRAADGTSVHVPPGGHVDVFASRGSVQWQPRVRYGDPAAIVRLTEAGPVALRVTSDLPRLPHELRATTDTRAWRLPPVNARALGPHAVTIGWFPRVRAGAVTLERIDERGARVALGVLPAPVSSYTDATALAGAHYTYIVRRPDAHPVDVGVDMPRELPASGIDIIRGKAMWLSFADVSHWDVDAMLDRASAAGLRAIELRMTYGECTQITTVRKATIDRFIDGAAQRGIAVVGWTVPRAVTFEDLATNVDAAAYRTPAGHGISGLAVDLERGSDFIAGTSVGAPELADYLQRLRAAVGPRVLLVATIEDGYLERLPDTALPVAAIARYADVLQPMVYWRMRDAGASIDGMRREMAASYARTLQLAGRDIPIDVGGQAVNLANGLGAPPPAELEQSFAQAHSLGAIGETVFDWDGTSQLQWSAIARAAWPLPAIQ